MDVKSLHGFLHGIKWFVVHGHLDYFQNPPLGIKPTTKLGDHGTSNAYNLLITLFFFMCEYLHK